MPHRGYAVLGGIAAGIAGGFFGVGGGIILVPMLTGVFRLTQHQAHGTSLAIVGGAAIVSLAVYAFHGNVAWTTALVVGLTCIVGARMGARLAAKTSSARLAQAFAVLLVLVGIRMLFRIPAGAAHPTFTPAGIALALAIGWVMGLLSGFMGVGGGVIAVPAFTLAFGMSQQLAQGTSLAAILVTAPVGAIEHARHGNVVTALIPPFAIGAALGAPFASLLAQHLPQAELTRAFAVFVLASAVHIWLRANKSAAKRVRSA